MKAYKASQAISEKASQLYNHFKSLFAKSSKSAPPEQQQIKTQVQININISSNMGEDKKLDVPVTITSGCRSSRSQMFFKIGVLKIFEIFTGKLESLFDKVLSLKASRLATLLKRESNTCFAVNISKFLKNLGWLLL